MYKKPPLVKGRIHDVILPALSAELNERANIEPETPANAVISYFQINKILIIKMILFRN